MNWLIVQVQYEENILGNIYYVIYCIYDDKLNSSKIWCSDIPFRKKLNYKILSKYLKIRCWDFNQLKKLSITEDKNKLIERFMEYAKNNIFELKKVLNFYEVKKKEEKEI